MILKCEFAKKDRPLLIVSVQNIEVDDCDAESIINEPAMLNAQRLVCVSAVPYGYKCVMQGCKGAHEHYSDICGKAAV